MLKNIFFKIKHAKQHIDYSTSILLDFIKDVAELEKVKKNNKTDRGYGAGVKPGETKKAKTLQFRQEKVKEAYDRGL